jgi:hypothetical protein
MSKRHEPPAEAPSAAAQQQARFDAMMAATPGPPVDPARAARRAELLKGIQRVFGARRPDWGRPAGERPPDEEPPLIPPEVLEKMCTPAWALELPEPRPKLVKDVMLQGADGVWCTYRAGMELPATVSRAQADQWIKEGSCARVSMWTVQFHIRHWQRAGIFHPDLYAKLAVLPEPEARWICAPMGRNTLSWRDWERQVGRAALASGRPWSGSIDIGDGRFVPSLRTATDADYDCMARPIPSWAYYTQNAEPWRGDPNTLPPCAPPARQVLLNDGFCAFDWVRLRSLRYISFVYIPGQQPEGRQGNVPYWIEEQLAVTHAKGGKGRFINLNELTDESLESLAGYREAQGRFYILYHGQQRFNSPDYLPDERMGDPPAS